MPKLTWEGKAPVVPTPTQLSVESIVKPQNFTPNSHLSSPADPSSNKLIFGENFDILSTLLEDYRGKVSLIYIDPPFFTNRKFNARMGKGEDSRKPELWNLTKGYTDQWKTLDAYIDFLYQRLSLMVQLLSSTGTIYLHLDWHADSYARLLMDELLGEQNFLNEIIWTYHGPSPIKTAFNRKHDTILAYTKSEKYTFNVDAVRVPYNENTKKTFNSSTKAGFGKVPDLERGKVPEDWWYFPVVARLHGERTGYPTQKPEGLLERVILASSNPGELVADFFCGSGTTAVVASRLGRNFITSDATFRSIQTTRERLVRNNAQPFTIYHSAGIAPELPPPAAPYFEKTNSSIKLLPTDQVVYWEIDPAWDGSTFHSVYQATTAVRSEEMNTEISINPIKNKKIAVRAILKNDQQIQQIFD